MPALLLLPAGCIGLNGDGGIPEEYRNATPSRGEGEPMSVRAQVETPGDADSPDDAAGYRRRGAGGTDGEADFSYRHSTFEAWASEECPDLVADHVEDLLSAELPDTDYVRMWVLREEDGMSVTVRYIRYFDRDGTLIGEPSVDYRRVVEATPRSVDATLELDGRTHTCRYPVSVEKYAMQEQ